MENYGICEKCGYPLKFRERPDTIHHGEIYCPKCGKHVRWVPKPDKKSSGRKTTSRYDVVAVAKHHGFEKPFCFFCGRTQEQLGTNETLTVDHILPLSEGGTDTLNNLQILCSACHQLKNWATVYLRKHLLKR